MTKRLLAAAAFAFPLLTGAAAFAGPGSLPPHLLRDGMTGERWERAPYALTGDVRSRDDDGWTARLQSVGGARDARNVFERGDVDDWRR